MDPHARITIGTLVHQLSKCVKMTIIVRIMTGTMSIEATRPSRLFVNLDLAASNTTGIEDHQCTVSQNAVWKRENESSKRIRHPPPHLHLSRKNRHQKYQPLRLWSRKNPHHRHHLLHHHPLHLQEAVLMSVTNTIFTISKRGWI